MSSLDSEAHLRHPAANFFDDDSDNDSDGEDWESVDGDPTDGALPSDDGVLYSPDDRHTNTTNDNSLDPASMEVDSPRLPDQVPTSQAAVRTALAKKLLKQCVKNWKVASAEETKKMWGIFDESGLFASACRHGFILWLVDMVRSGEL